MQGFLPSNGGFRDQTYWYVIAMDIIDREMEKKNGKP